MKFLVQVCEEKVATWEDSIKLSAKPLLEDGSIKPEYVDAIIENVVENGPYIVVAPNIAIPHARSERGAIKTAVAVTKLKEPVLFPEDKEVSILICLSAQDVDQHSDTLARLSNFFIDDDLVEEVMNTQDPAVIQNVFDNLDED